MTNSTVNIDDDLILSASEMATGTHILNATETAILWAQHPNVDEFSMFEPVTGRMITVKYNWTSKGSEDGKWKPISGFLIIAELSA